VSFKEEPGISGPFAFQTDSTTWVADVKVATSVPVVIFEKPLLSFTFADVSQGTAIGNGQNLGDFTSYAVLGSFAGSVFTPFTLNGAYDLILGFNDGLRVDSDYDDMVVGLKVAAIPEPETYALLMAGLGAVGFISRRRRKS
jgi:hypothetical protein